MNQKVDKTTLQLQHMEELMYFVLIMLKCISPSDTADPSVPAGPLQLAEQGVAIESPQVVQEPPVATTSQLKPSSSKKDKKK